MTRARDRRPSPWQLSLDRRAAEGLEWARWAVGRWSDFPVDEHPRPLVLVGSRVRVQQGFATGDAKRAFLEGRVRTSVTVPEGVVAELAGEGRPGPSPGARPLVITAAEPAETEFLTDRGRRPLPAWRLTAEDALGPIWVLNPSVSDWRPAADAGGPPPSLQAPGHGPGARVEVGPDDRTLVVHWLGAVPAFERYPTAEVVESAQAFAVVAIGEDIGPPGARTAAGHVHRVPAVLREPLGARVYVDLHGNAGQVTHLV